jgi:adenylosuccinate lyase
MEENLQLTGGMWSSGSLLLELAKRGMDRQAAYVIVQRNAMRVYEQGADFKAALLGDEELRGKMSEEDIEACFSLDHHLRHVDDVFKRVFGE